jgi:hypothetical protein
MKRRDITGSPTDFEFLSATSPIFIARSRHFFFFMEKKGAGNLTFDQHKMRMFHPPRA